MDALGQLPSGVSHAVSTLPAEPSSFATDAPVSDAFGTTFDSVWNGESLDAILGAAMPDFDLSAYQAFEDAMTAGPQGVPAWDGSSTQLQPGDVYLATISQDMIPQWDSSIAQQPDHSGYTDSFPGRGLVAFGSATDGEFLNDFCEWTIAD